MIGLDAFSSDAIPGHLITRKRWRSISAIERRPGGRVPHQHPYLDLSPFIIALANDAHATGALGERSPDTEGRGKLYYGSRWMVLAKHREVLDELVKIDGWYRLGTWPASRLWTDDYTDVLSAMKWKN